MDAFKNEDGSWNVTKISAVVAAVLGALSLAGVIDMTPEAINATVAKVAEAAVTIVGAVVAVLSSGKKSD